MVLVFYCFAMYQRLTFLKFILFVKLNPCRDTQMKKNHELVDIIVLEHTLCIWLQRRFLALSLSIVSLVQNNRSFVT